MFSPAGPGALPRLYRAVPRSEEYLRALTDRGEPLARAVRAHEEMLDEYGLVRLAAAIDDALLPGRVMSPRRMTGQPRRDEGAGGRALVVLDLLKQPDELGDADLQARLGKASKRATWVSTLSCD